jgi:hypothetical protein
MKQVDLRRVLTDKRYVTLPDEDRERLKFIPHQVRYNAEHNRMVLLLAQSLKGDDYSINDDAIRSLVDLQADKKIKKGYVVQIDRDGRFVAQQTCYEVNNKLVDHSPRAGEWGEYFYLRANTFEVNYGRRGSRRRREGSPLPF